MSPRPAAMLSLDLDNLWAYQRTRGDAGWQAMDSFLDVAVPRIRALLQDTGLTITVFVVGRDLTLPGVPALVAELAGDGHEIGNHSLDHAIDLHRADAARLAADLDGSAALIAEVAGRAPVGFRGPAFRLSEPLLDALAARGYHYDASILPALTGPLARAWHRRGMAPGAAEAPGQDDLFGSWREASRSLRPGRWQRPAGTLVELPVTTLPMLRVPVHWTYLNFIADRAGPLADACFRLHLRLCRWRSVTPSLLLHATDFIGADDACCPHFLPGMRRPAADKLAMLRRQLVDLGKACEVMPLARFVGTLEPARLPLLASPPS